MTSGETTPAPDLEIWKPVVGREGRYEVSNLGRVRSLRSVHHNCDVPRKVPLILTQYPSARGWVRVMLARGKRSGRMTSLHRTVLEAFAGPCPPGHQAAHLDNNRQNNVASNLVWATPKENCAHKRIHGTDPTGERNPNAKLREVDVREIRAARSNGLPAKDLAERFGVSIATIRSIDKGLVWKHVV